MKTKVALLAALLLAALLASGCGLARNLTGSNAGTVSELWPDVPRLDGATQVKMDIPLPMQLIIQTFIQAANADNSSDTKLDKFDFVAYQTSMSPQQVSEFYTTEKMQAAGWNAQDATGCGAGTDTSGSSPGGAGLCVFGKKGDAGKSTILLIIPVPEENSNNTQVFYVRFEGTTKTQP